MSNAFKERIKGSFSRCSPWGYFATTILDHLMDVVDGKPLQLRESEKPVNGMVRRLILRW